VFVALFIEHEKRMRRIVLLSVASPDLQCFFLHYLIKGIIFGEEVTGHKMCFDFLCKFFRNISHSKKNLAICYLKCT